MVLGDIFFLINTCSGLWLFFCLIFSPLKKEPYMPSIYLYLLLNFSSFLQVGYIFVTFCIHIGAFLYILLAAASLASRGFAL